MDEMRSEVRALLALLRCANENNINIQVVMPSLVKDLCICFKITGEELDQVLRRLVKDTISLNAIYLKYNVVKGIH
jgi:hypothetical protein